MGKWVTTGTLGARLLSNAKIIFSTTNKPTSKPSMEPTSQPTGTPTSKPTTIDQHPLAHADETRMVTQDHVGRKQSVDDYREKLKKKKKRKKKKKKIVEGSQLPT